MAKVCPNCELTYSDDDFFCAADGSPLRSTGADADNLVGTVIADRYRIESIIGEGGMGRVYRARHVRVPREAAIKVLRRALISDPYAVASFNREARNAASVGDHPNVASVYDFGETSDGLVFLAMEYIEGETLSRRLERERTLSPRRAVEIVRQIAAGLTVAHELPEPVVHRDLKPDNILLKATRDGSDWVKVVDFGIAKAVKRDTQLLTTPGLVVGTPRYMSPEQLTGGTIDVRSDIYALGLMAFQMLTGRMPFASASRDDESTIQWALQRLTLQPLTLKQVRPDVDWPAAAQDAFDGALATAAADRTPSANEFARSLAHAFGLTTPSGVVALVPEAPGPVSSAVRSAAESTMPTAPITAASETPPPRGAPGQSPRSDSPPAESAAPQSANKSRTLVGVVAAVVIVAGAAGLLWFRASAASAGRETSIAQSPPPNDAVRPQRTDTVSRASASGAGGTPSARSDTLPAVPGRRGTPARTTEPPVPSNPPAARPGLGGGSSTGVATRLPSADVTAAIGARTALDSVKAVLADVDAVASSGSGPVLLRRLNQLLRTLTAKTDSVEAMYYLIETNLIMDRPREACVWVSRARKLSAGTEFAPRIQTFAQDPDLACSTRRSP